MRQDPVGKRVAGIIGPVVADMGYDLVRVRLLSGGRPVLQVMAERADAAPMTVGDCAAISRAVSTLLDVEDPVGGAWELEVSSPGMDRPLVRRDDFDRFAGFEAKLQLSDSVDGRKRFRGRLLGLEGATVRLEMADGSGEVRLDFDAIDEAKLVITDGMLAAAAADR